MARRESDYSRPTVKRRGMRTGYTTGACAAAAAKAATIALLSGEPVSEVTIRLPIGRDATFQIHRCQISEDDKIYESGYSDVVVTTATAMCSVVKDGGDDPDVTSGAEICARVWLAHEAHDYANVAQSFDSPASAEATISAAYKEGDEHFYDAARVGNPWVGSEVTLRGGVGVGSVTKPGTGIDIGEPSITRVPRRMITQSVQDAAKDMQAVTNFIVEISVPGGDEIARMTDNPRLGIVGGISILGTTGVVQPFSTAAWRASVNVSIDVAAANHLSHMVISTGTQSEEFAKRWLGLTDMAYVNVGIFTGSSLKRCVQRNIPRATLVGMIGKFSKIAMGKFVTHVAGNKVDPVFLASLAVECGASKDVQSEMRHATSGRHFQEIAIAHGMEAVFNLVCERVCEEAHAYLGVRAADIVVDAICFDFEGAILGKATTSNLPIPLLDAVASDD